jgi:hypothetical protein
MSFSFKDPLSIDNNKYLKWIDSTSTTRQNIIVLDSSNNVRINAVSGGSMYLGNNVGVSVYIGSSLGNNVVIPSKLGVGFNTDALISGNITLPSDGLSYIGTNTSTGTNTGVVGLSGGYSLNATHGSRVLLYGAQHTSGNTGNIDLYAAKNGKINMYTGNDSLKFTLSSAGSFLFSPDGSTITVDFSSTRNLITTPMSILDTSNSIGLGTGGSFTVLGGAAVNKDLYVGGDITSASDMRLKNNIRVITDETLSKVLKIHPVKYTDYLDREKYGFIAQDFEEDYPEMIKSTVNGMYSLDYQKLTVLLWKCIHELVQNKS